MAVFRLIFIALLAIVGAVGLPRSSASEVISPDHRTCHLQLKRIGERLSSPHFRGAELAPGLVQLTGTYLRQNDESVHVIPEIPDPATPYTDADGSVLVFGSAPYALRFADYETFERGGAYSIQELDLRHPNGRPARGNYGHPWDPRRYRLFDGNRFIGETIVAGSMQASNGRDVPLFPDDNPGRRLFEFWNGFRRTSPIIGDSNSGWKDHSYGHELVQDGNADPNTIDISRPYAMIYDKVSLTYDNQPMVTEIFIVPMKGHLEPAGEPKKIVSVLRPDGQPYSAARRTLPEGGLLVEGGRLFATTISGRKIYILGFSAGDFCTDGYTISFAWSDSLFGPYHVVTTSQGDIRDFGSELKHTFGLSFAGRPVVFQTPAGDTRLMFHAVLKKHIPDHDYSAWRPGMPLDRFYRALFMTPIELALSSGQLDIRLPASSHWIPRTGTDPR